ncbi:MAG: glycosyltransferase family 4 protein [Acidobacteria bacterium]|nr:glycosyltransferase family 4 protein [Acidobacteriota bacterium]
MLIGIDAHAIGSRLTGNETYIRNLIPALAELDQEYRYVLFFTIPDAAETWRSRFPNVAVQLVHPGTPYLRIPFVLPWLARRLRIDLLHVQYIAPPRCPVPFVTTIHDISFEHFPEFFRQRDRLIFHRLIRNSAERARRVLTVSEFSRQDLVKTYGLDAERVVLTPNGLGRNFRPIPSSASRDATLARYGIADPYVLSVGNLQPRKNLVRLIRAFVALREQDDRFTAKLVFVGKKAWLYDEIFQAARASRFGAEIQFTGYVAEEDLPAIYSAARIFVYPSIFEGFGLPVLEALGCGAPVATSNSSSLPEVAGDAAIAFDPLDERALREAMAQLWHDRELSARLRIAGPDRARRFTWRETARLTLAAYQHAVGLDATSPPPVGALS